jgi:hypothetical protein
MHEVNLTGAVIPYSAEEAINLRGSNDLSAKEAFYERKKYKELPLFMGLPHPLYSWYKSVYFGRVDSIQNAIVVNPLGPLAWGDVLSDRGIATHEHNRRSTLKQIKSKAGNVFVLNFVADAFTDLKNHLRRAGDARLINSENSVYYKIEATAGFENYQNSFRDLNRSWGVRFTNWIKSSKKLDDDTLNFKSYVAALLEYMGTGINDVPLTLTGYVMSNYASPMISGLSIELKKKPDYSDDSVKFKTYISDPNFQYFVKAARKYGFYVDRNGPWKITADPLSPVMFDKMRKQFNSDCEQIGGYLDAASSQTFFDTFYQRTYKLDLEKLKKTLREMYNKFAQDYPRVIVRATSTVGNCPTGAVEEIITRKPISFGDAEGLGDLFWLHTYFKIRTLESKVTFAEYDQQIRMINNIYKAYGEQTAMRYINNEIKPYLYNLHVGKKPLTKEEGPVRIGTVKEVQRFRAQLQGETSMNVGHRHQYQVDADGNGWASFAFHPDEPNIKHKHRIIRWAVQSEKSECYPNCESLYGIRGAPPHSHALLGIGEAAAPTGLLAAGVSAEDPGAPGSSGTGGGTY